MTASTPRSLALRAAAGGVHEAPGASPPLPSGALPLPPPPRPPLLLPAPAAPPGGTTISLASSTAAVGGSPTISTSPSPLWYDGGCATTTATALAVAIADASGTTIASATSVTPAARPTTLPVSTRVPGTRSEPPSSPPPSPGHVITSPTCQPAAMLSAKIGTPTPTTSTIASPSSSP